MKKGEIWLVEIPSSNSHEQGGLRPEVLMFYDIILMDRNEGNVMGFINNFFELILLILL